jgi:hypothetical protein
LVGSEREQRLACFLPLLHLSNNQKLWLEQENHLDEIWIYLYDYFDKNRDLFIEVVNEMEEVASMANMAGSSVDENSMNLLEEEKEKTGLEVAKQKLEDKRKLAEEARKELEKELGWDISEIEKEEKIDKISGFDENL